MEVVVAARALRSYTALKATISYVHALPSITDYNINVPKRMGRP